MTVSISIDPADHPDDSDLSSLSEDEGSGVHVNHPSNESHEYLPYEDGWALPFPDELKPSDSASRPRTSHRPRSLHARSVSGRRQPTRRPMNPDRDYVSHTRRHSPESPGSADSADEYPQQFARAPQDRRWPPAGGRGYPQSVSSGSYNNHPFPQGHTPFPHQNGPPSDQLILGHTTPNGQPFPPPGYPYGPHNGHPMHPYYQEQAHPRHHHQPPPQSRMDPHSHQPLPPHMAAHGVHSPYGGPHFPHEMMPYNPNNYYNGFREPYGMYPGMMHPSYFPYPPIQPAAQPEPKSPPAPAADEAVKEAPKEEAPAPAPDPKDDAIARLEKLILDERLEREAKEAARLAAIEAAAAEKAERERQLAHDRAIAEAAASEAATLARADAEARAKEDAAKAKEEAEKAAADAAVKAKEDAEKAATDAATKALEAANLAATKAKEEEEAKNRVPPPEKKKPIKFKDAVGRKFSFPFELCATWQGMEDLIKQAFLHIEVIGPHVAEGHYDLVGPNGDIILPQVWETVVEPDWTITMHMWPIPEKPKEPDPPPAEAPPPPAAPPKAAPDVKKKEGAKKAPSPAFANWVMGRRVPPRVKKAAKAEKKDEPAPQ